jgi:SAM-dependent methyltransferase
MRFVQTLKRTARPWICPFDPILEAIPRGKIIFDIGCGSGFLLGLAGGSKSPRQLFGVEIDGDLVAASRDYLALNVPDVAATVSVYDGVAFPESLAEADVVLLVDVLHHVPKDAQQAFVTSIHEKMKRGGRLILKDIDAGRPLLCLCNKLHDLLAAGEIGNELTASETERRLTSLGFEIVGRGAERRVWYPHYWFICEKK